MTHYHEITEDELVLNVLRMILVVLVIGTAFGLGLGYIIWGVIYGCAC